MVIDILFLVTLISGFAWGFKRGVIHSLFAFIALFFGVLIALKFSHSLAFYLHESLGLTAKLLPFACFLMLFIGVIIVVRIISALIEKVISSLYLGFINRLMGGLLWSIIVTFIFSTLLWFVDQIVELSPELKLDSTTYPYLQTLSPIIIDFFAELIPYFEGLFDALEELFNNFSSDSQGDTLVKL